MDDFDPRKPNIARIYDALRDGKDNFGPDREEADAIREIAADGQRAAHDNRAFLARAVRFLIRQEGVYQFLDIGSGLPADQNTHEIAHALSPRARTAYLDYDPVVAGHAKAVLEDQLTSIALPGDLRNPQELMADPALRKFIDFGKPVAVLLLAVLHFVETPLAYEVTRAVMRETAPGSLLVVSHASADQATADEIRTISEIYDKARTPIYLRTRDETTAFFDGLEITEPGVTDINAWRNPAYQPARTIGYGGIARKNT
jgi:S-adenosyl methyltransferase